MLENYDIDEFGVIYQVEKSPIKYDADYVSAYDGEGHVKREAILNGIRLGFTIACNDGIIPDSILDFGYGKGTFLKVASNIIPNCYGYDITDVSLPEGCKEGSLEEHYDIITFFDSLEHVEDLSFIKDLNCNMVIISVPYCKWKDDNDDDEWFKHWKHRRPDEHLWHFNNRNLTNLMAAYGYYLTMSTSIEDAIRDDKFNNPNIMTFGFKKDWNHADSYTI